MRRARDVDDGESSHMEQEGTVMYEDPSETLANDDDERPGLVSAARSLSRRSDACVRSTRSIFRPRLRVVPLRVRRHPALARVEEVRKGGDAVTFRASTRRSRCRCRNSFIGYKWRRCYCYGTMNYHAPRRHASAPKAVRTRAFTAWRRSSPAWTDAPQWRRTWDGRRRREEGCQCGETSTARGSGRRSERHASSSRITRARSRSHLIRQDLVAAPDVLLDLVHGDGRRAREPESEARDAGAQHDAVFLSSEGNRRPWTGQRTRLGVMTRATFGESVASARSSVGRSEGVERSDEAPASGSPRRVPIEPRARPGIFRPRRSYAPVGSTPGVWSPTGSRHNGAPAERAKAYRRCRRCR